MDSASSDSSHGLLQRDDCDRVEIGHAVGFGPKRDSACSGNGVVLRREKLFAVKRDSEPAHYKNRNADRLKDGALLIFWPAAQATPDRGQDACETRQAAENPVGKSVRS